MELKYLYKEAIYYNKLGGFSRAFKKFLFSQTPLRKRVNSKTYNRIYLKLVRTKIRKIKPSILQIENTNKCNAKCLMCPHHLMKRKNRVMSLVDFKKILNSVMKSYPIKIITVTGFGEPFLDPGLIDKLKYINEKYPKLKIDLYTNGSVLTKKLADELLQRKIWKVTFSINGTGKNYKKIVGLNYEITKRNVLYFLSQKRKLKSKILTNVSAMLLKENEKEIAEFMKFWSPHTNSVRIYSPSDWAGTLDTKNFLKIDSFAQKRWPCIFLWKNITVDVGGNLIMCCRDYESRVKFGNLLKQDIVKIRNSDSFKKLLKKQARFDFDTPICGTCDNSFDSSLDWWD